MEDLNDIYEQILEPKEFVKHFNDMLEFRIWCYEGSILDLTEMLVYFVNAELYEYCVVIKDVIDIKKSDLEYEK